MTDKELLAITAAAIYAGAFTHSEEPLTMGEAIDLARELIDFVDAVGKPD